VGDVIVINGIDRVTITQLHASNKHFRFLFAFLRRIRYRSSRHSPSVDDKLLSVRSTPWGAKNQKLRENKLTRYMSKKGIVT
jgi:hypothetical protein